MLLLLLGLAGTGGTGGRSGFLAVALLIAIASVAHALLSRATTHWTLTSDRLIAREGIFARRNRQLELADIRAIEVEQSFTQRILGLGDIAVSSAASADYLIRLRDVNAPESLADTLRQARLRRIA